MQTITTMHATTTYQIMVKNEDCMHFYMTNWSRNHQQIVYSPHFVKCNMQLDVTMIKDIVIVYHKYELLH
jgi:hypothetical protein